MSQTGQIPNSSFTSVAYATVTEAAVLRGRVDTLEEELHEARHAIEELRQQNELLRRQLVALRDGAWLEQK